MIPFYEIDRRFYKSYGIFDVVRSRWLKSKHLRNEIGKRRESCRSSSMMRINLFLGVPLRILRKPGQLDVRQGRRNGRRLEERMGRSVDSMHSYLSFLYTYCVSLDGNVKMYFRFSCVQCLHPDLWRSIYSEISIRSRNATSTAMP